MLFWNKSCNFATMNDIIIKKRELKTSYREEEDGTLVMSFEGWFDTSASTQVKHEMQVFSDKYDRNIILDLSALKYISSSGLRLFLNLLKETRAHGGSVKITGMSDYLNRVFDETGFTRLFNYL